MKLSEKYVGAERCSKMNDSRPQVDLNTPNFLSRHFREQVLQQAEVHYIEHDYELQGA